MFLFVDDNSGILFLSRAIIDVIVNEILKFRVHIDRIRRFTIER